MRIASLPDALQAAGAAAEAGIRHPVLLSPADGASSLGVGLWRDLVDAVVAQHPAAFCVLDCGDRVGWVAAAARVRLPAVLVTLSPPVSAEPVISESMISGSMISGSLISEPVGRQPTNPPSPSPAPQPSVGTGSVDLIQRLTALAAQAGMDLYTGIGGPVLDLTYDSRIAATVAAWLAAQDPALFSGTGTGGLPP